MLRNTQEADDLPEDARHIAGQEVEYYMKEDPDDQRYQVGDDLVIGEAAGKQADADISATDQE